MKLTVYGRSAGMLSTARAFRGAAASAWQRTPYSTRLSGRRGRDTKPELTLRRAVFALGGRYRLNGHLAPRLRADIVFPRARVAVFVDGCFWHGCPSHGPKTFRGPNARLWQTKLRENRARDRRAVRSGVQSGWRVVRVWECEVETSAFVIAERLLGMLEPV